MHKDERGQSVILLAIILPCVFGFLAFAIDLGLVAYHMAKLQNSADLAVLTGAQSLPENPAEAQINARNNFIDNYGTDAPIKNIVLFNGEGGVKIIYKETVSLYFLPIIGKESININGKAEAIVEPLGRPDDIVPIGLNQTTAFIPGAVISLWGDLNDPVKGNFGLVDPTSDNSLGPADFEYYIANDYKGEKGMPEYNETVTTKTGSMGHKVEEGFKQRKANGKDYIVCPVVDFSGISGKKEVTILGYARFEVIEVVSLNGSHVTITGKFVEYIDTKALGMKEANYYGIKTIRLIK
jgi:hypothetical protein